VSKFRQAFRESSLFHLYKSISARGEYASWKFRNVPGAGAPHLVKQRTIAEFARKFNLHVLVETGVNFAHMLYVNQNRFREIYSIELDSRRAESARRKFAKRTNIHVLQGDSGKVLPQLLPALKSPAFSGSMRTTTISPRPLSRNSTPSIAIRSEATFC
jgi:hypothetical protein